MIWYNLMGWIPLWTNEDEEWDEENDDWNEGEDDFDLDPDDEEE